MADGLFPASGSSEPGWTTSAEQHVGAIRQWICCRSACGTDTRMTADRAGARAADEDECAMDIDYYVGRLFDLFSGPYGWVVLVILAIAGIMLVRGPNRPRP
jgi:hypothetical protein